MLKKQKIIFIEGPVGKLETTVLYPDDAGLEKGIAILNHPNPLYGGSNTNKVIRTVGNTLREMGYICYLPNLRGTGESEGSHDYGEGETEDVLSVCAYARNLHPDLSTKIVLGGFSFGAYVSARAAHRFAHDRLLLVGAAVNKYREPAPFVPDVGRSLIIHGDQDEVIALADILDWCGGQNLPLVVIAGAGHFFHGKLLFLSASIRRFFES